MADICQSLADPDKSGLASYPDVDLSDDENEDLDPRVQEELETLNSASSEINTLETELEKSRNKFRMILTDSTQKLNSMFKKLGKCVLKARPYYDLLKESKQAQAEAQKAAVHFQRANSIYLAAKEMVQLAEERNNVPSDVDDRKQFDSAWQEMLNHATIKFMESEKKKRESEEEHLQKAAQYATIQQKLQYYEKDISKTIQKAKTYFDLKDKLEKQLQVERVNVEDLQMGLMCAKQKYRSALSNLEAISDEIHEKRKKRLKLPPRTPGVGAESDISSLPEINLDNLSDFGSQISVDDRDGDGVSLPDCTISSTEVYHGLVRPVTNQLDTLELKSAAVSERKEVVEGSETVSITGNTEEAKSLTLSHHAASCTESSMYKQINDKPRALQTVRKAEKRHHLHNLHSQRELPILQHLRDNNRQTSMPSDGYAHPAGGATRRYSPPGGSASATKTTEVTDEVFV